MAVELDVGGIWFKTTVDTLTSVPDSFLGRMFSGDWQNAKDKEGRVFIDRDGEIFKYVLDFLRNGPKMILPDHMETKKKIKVEAEFYSLPQLVELIASRGQPTSYWPVAEFNSDVEMFTFSMQRNSKWTYLALSLVDLRRVPASYFAQLADKIQKRGENFDDAYCYGDLWRGFSFRIPNHTQYNVFLLLKFLQVGPVAITEKDIEGDIRELLQLAMMLSLPPAVQHINSMISKD